MVPQDLPHKITKIAAAICAKFPHRIRAKHSVAFELRFGKKLIARALVWERLAPLKVFVDVTWFMAVTSGFDINNHTIGHPGTVHC